MLKKEFIENLNNLGISQKRFSVIVGYSYQAVKQWKDDNIPSWVSIVIEHLELVKNNQTLSEKYFDQST